MPASNFKANGYTIGPADSMDTGGNTPPATVIKGVSSGLDPQTITSNDTGYGGDIVLAAGLGAHHTADQYGDPPGRVILRGYAGNEDQTEADLIWEPRIGQLHAPGYFQMGCQGIDGAYNGGIWFGVNFDVGNGSTGKYTYPVQTFNSINCTTDLFNVVPTAYTQCYRLSAAAVRTIAYLKVQATLLSGTTGNCEIVQILVAGQNALTFKHQQGSVPSGSMAFSCDGAADIVANPGDLLLATRIVATGGFWKLKKL